MTRPSEEQVDEAFDYITSLEVGRNVHSPKVAALLNHGHTLAAEICALNEEIEALSACGTRDIKALDKVREQRDTLAEQHVELGHELAALIGRVEALLELFRRNLQAEVATFVNEKLEAALRGDP